MDTLNGPQGTFRLARFPHRKRENLRAWDAADEYLLNHIAEHRLIDSGTRVLLLNDGFGALATAIASIENIGPVISVSDSWLAHCGTRANLKNNQMASDRVTLHSSLEWPQETFDLVLIKVPKSLSLLEDQLHRLRPLLSARTTVIGGGMVKAIHSSTLTLFEKIIGETKTSLAAKKSRLIFANFDPAAKAGKNPYPKQYRLESSDYQISNHANVFSREKLDIGTRFFLEHLPSSEDDKKIIDLGCGNGLVGLIAAERNPQATVTCVDESFMAVASAQANIEHAFPDCPHNFQVTDCLAGIKKNSADLILNNPPFHQQNAVGDHIALQMFNESKTVLKTGGELWVIGNRHLGYHVRLKRLFGNCQTLASNKKFVILRAVKR